MSSNTKPAIKYAPLRLLIPASPELLAVRKCRASAPSLHSSPVPYHTKHARTVGSPPERCVLGPEHRADQSDTRDWYANGRNVIARDSAGVPAVPGMQVGLLQDICPAASSLSPVATAALTQAIPLERALW